jgi:hypothetical protein
MQNIYRLNNKNTHNGSFIITEKGIAEKLTSEKS